VTHNTSGEALRVESIGTTELRAANWTQYPAADSNVRQPLTAFRRSGYMNLILIRKYLDGIPVVNPVTRL
jgi:hypothetical protein